MDTHFRQVYRNIYDIWTLTLSPPETAHQIKKQTKGAQWHKKKSEILSWRYFFSYTYNTMEMYLWHVCAVQCRCLNKTVVVEIVRQ